MKNSDQSHDKEGIQMLSISDWISYLSSEKNPNLGNIVSIGAFLLAAFAVIMSVTNNTLLGVIPAILIAIALIIYFVKIGRLFGGRADKAGKLLKDIMSGDQRDVLKIEEEWKEFLMGKKRKSKKE